MQISQAGRTTSVTGTDVISPRNLVRSTPPRTSSESVAESFTLNTEATSGFCSTRVLKRGLVPKSDSCGKAMPTNPSGGKMFADSCGEYELASPMLWFAAWIDVRNDLDA